MNHRNKKILSDAIDVLKRAAPLIATDTAKFREALVVARDGLKGEAELSHLTILLDAVLAMLEVYSSRGLLCGESDAASRFYSAKLMNVAYFCIESLEIEALMPFAENCEVTSVKS